MKRSPSSAGAPPRPDQLLYAIADLRCLGGPAPSTVYKLLADGKLRGVHIGRRHYVDGDSVRELLKNGFAPKDTVS